MIPSSGFLPKAASFRHENRDYAPANSIKHCTKGDKMATQRQPDAQDIEALVAFLPRLYGDDAPPLVLWKEAEENDDGILVILPPEYDERVEEFMELVVSQSCWLDPHYLRKRAGERLGNEAQVRNATIPEIQTMLTFIVRGERFCDGFWAEIVESGPLRRLLERLSAILQEWPTGDHASGEQ